MLFVYWQVEEVLFYRKVRNCLKAMQGIIKWDTPQFWKSKVFKVIFFKVIEFRHFYWRYCLKFFWKFSMMLIFSVTFCIFFLEISIKFRKQMKIIKNHGKCFKIVKKKVWKLFFIKNFTFFSNSGTHNTNYEECICNILWPKNLRHNYMQYLLFLFTINTYLQYGR